jgi:predicted nucleic acid-binding protein
VPVLVDSNVILDITNDDPVWADWSDLQITKYQASGLFVNAPIYSELCAGAVSTSEVDIVLANLKLEYFELPRQALFYAAKTFLKYRRQGGTKTAPLPDFFIGAHAATLGIPLLTRDRGRYLTYFPELTLICP